MTAQRPSAETVTFALAMRAETVIHQGDFAEVTTPVGTTGREEAMSARNSLQEDPVGWILEQIPHLTEIIAAYEAVEGTEEEQLVQARLDQLATKLEAEHDPNKPWSLFNVTVFLRDATLRNGKDQ